MKEYCILRRHGQARAFRLDSYHTIFQAKEALRIMTGYDYNHHHAFFVDNDFFENKYPYGDKFEYYCIQEREVTEWKRYSEKSVSDEKTVPKEKNNILYFNNFI